MSGKSLKVAPYSPVLTEVLIVSHAEEELNKL